jgi:hypothetical protein
VMRAIALKRHKLHDVPHSKGIFDRLGSFTAPVV